MNVTMFALQVLQSLQAKQDQSVNECYNVSTSNPASNAGNRIRVSSSFGLRLHSRGNLACHLREKDQSVFLLRLET